MADLLACCGELERSDLLCGFSQDKDKNMYVQVKKQDLGRVSASSISPGLKAAIPLVSLMLLAGYFAYKK